jgi:hypothetical protein
MAPTIPHSRAVSLSLLPIFLLSMMGCQSVPGQQSTQLTVWSTVSPTFRASISIDRLAVLYPKTYDRDLMEAYSQQEGAVFQLKELRPGLRIVDRFNLGTVLGEQRLEASGLISDEYAVRLGRILGVDGILLYRIEGPSYRDRFFTRHGYAGEGTPGFVITSKVIMVETAEIVFHNVVTSRVKGGALELPAALDRGVLQAATDLLHAFR